MRLVPYPEEEIMAKWIIRIVIIVILLGMIYIFGTGAMMALQGGHT
jgi:hypothetical protein